MEPLLLEKIYSITYFKKLVDDVVLPPLNISDCPFPLTKEQLDFSKKVRNKKVLPIYTDAAPKGIPIDGPSYAINILRRIASGFIKMDFKFSDIVIPIDITFDDNPKLAAFLSLINRLGKEQAIVWINYVETGERITKTLKSMGFKVELINGSVTGSVREGIITEFQKGNLQFIVAHPKTIGTGLDFQNAKFQIFYELSYSLTEYSQAIKRSHRIKQDSPVWIYRMVGQDTIEEQVKEALDKKVDVEDFLFRNFLED
jgi:SNF2 family DNA or RNA helicase